MERSFSCDHGKLYGTLKRKTTTAASTTTFESTTDEDNVLILSYELESLELSEGGHPKYQYSCTPLE